MLSEIKIRKSKRVSAANPSNADVLRNGQDKELDELHNRISTLETENKQLRARPTEIKIKEDPSPTTESRRSANHNAYEKDVEGFLQQQ